MNGSKFPRGGSAFSAALNSFERTDLSIFLVVEGSHDTGERREATQAVVIATDRVAADCDGYSTGDTHAEAHSPRRAHPSYGPAVGCASAAEHSVRMNGIEVFLDRLNLSVAHDEEEVVGVLIGFAVLHLGVGFGLDSDAIALGCDALWSEAQAAVNFRAEVSNQSAELFFVLGSGEWKIALNPPGSAVAQGVHYGVAVSGAQVFEEAEDYPFVFFNAHRDLHQLAKIVTKSELF